MPALPIGLIATADDVTHHRLLIMRTAGLALTTPRHSRAQQKQQQLPCRSWALQTWSSVLGKLPARLGTLIFDVRELSQNDTEKMCQAPEWRRAVAPKAHRIVIHGRLDTEHTLRVIDLEGATGTSEIHILTKEYFESQPEVRLPRSRKVADKVIVGWNAAYRDVCGIDIDLAAYASSVLGVLERPGATSWNHEVLYLQDKSKADEPFDLDCWGYITRNTRDEAEKALNATA